MLLWMVNAADYPRITRLIHSQIFMLVMSYEKASALIQDRKPIPLYCWILYSMLQTFDDEDLDELARDVSLLKKLKRGKVSIKHLTNNKTLMK